MHPLWKNADNSRSEAMAPRSNRWAAQPTHSGWEHIPKGSPDQATWPVLSNCLCTGTIQSWWPMRTRISNACYRKHVALVTKERPRKGRRAEEATSSLRRRPLKQGGYGTTQPRVNNPDRPISSWKKYIPQRWNPTDVVECVPQASKMPFELHGLAAAHSALSNCTRIQFKAGISWYSTGNACCNKHAVAS